MSSSSRRSGATDTRRRKILLGAVFVVAGALTWWAGHGFAWSTAHAPSAATPAPVSIAGGAHPRGLAAGGRPRWTPTSRAAAVSAARDALIVYARKDVSRARWWAALAPRLSPAAAVSLRHTDRATITIGTVHGPAHIVAAPSTDLALTQIRTDGGVWTVLVSRNGPTARWLVERITSPSREGLCGAMCQAGAA